MAAPKPWLMTWIHVGGLDVPDLKPHFAHMHWRPMAHSMGVPVGSDWTDKADNDPVFGIYKQCGVWTDEESAILFNIAASVGGNWLDIGAHTGWTAAHQAEAGCSVIAVDCMLVLPEFAGRFAENADKWIKAGSVRAFAGMSNDFFVSLPSLAEPQTFSGVVIDGNHDRPGPIQDAQNAAKHLSGDGVILFHDFWGAPVQEAVTWLMDEGFKSRIYLTPHGVACCWRGAFVPPHHGPNPSIDWPSVMRGVSAYDFSRAA